jgi:hypothetical protein
MGHRSLWKVNTNSKGAVAAALSLTTTRGSLSKKLTPIDCLRLGWSIVPCGLNKQPLVKWKKFQTELPTEEQVLEWQEKLKPASWALITGMLSNRVVLDFDGETGARTREALGLPAPHRRSPRGGHHLDCLWPGFKVKTLTCKNDAALMERCPGCDPRGDGGFCIILGKSADGEYEWLLDSTDPYTLDAATWEVIQPLKSKKAKTKPKATADEKPNGSTKRVGVELLVRTALGKVTAGMGRNNAGAWLAIQLRDNNYSKAEALAVAFSERCPPTDGHGGESPYTPEEWAATLDSIYSQPAREPWSEPGETPPPLLLPSPVLLPPLDSAEIPFVDPAQEPQPASLNVNIADLLTKISEFMRRFVYMTATQVTIVALWVIHSHAIDATDFTPYLNIYSAMLRSGKTRLLEILKLLVRNPWFTGRTTTSALVRKIDRYKPTLLLDESDAAFEAKSSDYSEALRGILNTGFERDGAYTMNVPVGNSWEPRDFSTFAAKAIAGIGNKLPDTVKDRAIPIALKRKLKSDPVERFRKRKEKPKGAELHKLAYLWAQANVEVLSKAEPALPEELDDRRWDVCEPLLSIADLAGGEWPELARKALVSICGTGADTEDLSLRLLLDTRSVFTVEELRTEVLLGSLMTLNESPWMDYKRNSPLSARQLADLLRPFGIGSRTIHEGTGENRKGAKGYVKRDFKDAWERYLPSEDGPDSADPAKPAQHACQPCQPNVYVGPSEFSHPCQEVSGTDRKNEESPTNTRGGTLGTDEMPDKQVEDDSPDVEPWLTLEELAKYAGHDVPQEVSVLPKDWTPTDADSLDEDEEAD